MPGRPPLLGRRPMLIGHSAVGVLTVPIELVCALALESLVRDSVTTITYPMPHQVFEMPWLPHYAGKCPHEFLCVRSRKQNALRQSLQVT